jgi:hypothetical protein
MLNQTGGCDLPAHRMGVFVSLMKRLIFATAMAATFGAACAPSQAADLGVVRHVRHVGTAWRSGDWRDRCAWQGYYCLYAEYGFVYAYPFDDRPIAYAYYARRHHRRY